MLPAGPPPVSASLLTTAAAGIRHATRYGPGRAVTEAGLLADYRRIFELDARVERRLRQYLTEWKSYVPRTDRTANLVGELYGLLDELGVRAWDLDDALAVNRLGTLARFSSLLADYESVRRRARPDPDAPGEQDRGTSYYRHLAVHIINFAQAANRDLIQPASPQRTQIGPHRQSKRAAGLARRQPPPTRAEPPAARALRGTTGRWSTTVHAPRQRQEALASADAALH
jgi:hypothetical protein